MAIERKPPVGHVGYYHPHNHKYHSIEPLHHHSSESCVFKSRGKMSGSRRVIVFCVLVVFLPAVLLIIPLYIKNTIYATMAYDLIESDVLEINQGISNIFCSQHSLQTNHSVFNAFQVSQRPQVTSYRKHIRLKKSMELPDDTLEYWGFYLWKGATVTLSVCSRFEGASILVVKGEKELRTCGMLDHNKNKALNTGIFLPEAKQVRVFLESNSEINSKEMTLLKHREHNHANTTMDKSEKVSKINVHEKDSNAQVYSHEQLNYATAKSVDENVPTKPFQVKRDPQNNDLKTKAELNQNEEMKKIPTKETVSDKKMKLKALEEELKMIQEDVSKEQDDENIQKQGGAREKRNLNQQSPAVMSGQGIRHGGNNMKNLSDPNEESSISSFENGLLTCYEGNVLVSQEFDPSEKCLDVTYLMTGKHMQTIHNVMEDGYYYYIFYSDNDIVSNIIHAVFDIYKPTLQYENVTKSCINQTECHFTLDLFSKDRVIVEVPTRDGIEHESDDIFRLTSQCHPRMEIYAIFPIMILIFVLGCAFI